MQQLWQALSMLPFVILSVCDAWMMLRILITCMWMSAFVYHFMEFLESKKVARIFFVGDCVFQIASLASTTYASPCYPQCLKLVYVVFGSGAILGVFMSHHHHHAFVITSHVLKLTCAWLYACNRNELIKSSYWAFISAINFYLCDYRNIEFAWTIAHGTLLLYTWHMWRALELIGNFDTLAR